MESSDDITKKWDRANTLMRRDGAVAVADEITNKISLPKDMIKEPDGVVARYKAHAIERKAGVDLLRAWYGAQLEVAKKQLKVAVELKSKEVEMEAERFLMDLDKRQLQYLMQLEFANTEERIVALEKLGDATSRAMEKISSKDWPPKMVDDTIQGIIDLRQRFFDKIMKE
jgi:hypothetical protein